MKVKEFLEKLNQYDENTEVIFFDTEYCDIYRRMMIEVSTMEIVNITPYVVDNLERLTIKELKDNLTKDLGEYEIKEYDIILYNTEESISIDYDEIDNRVIISQNLN